MIIILCIYLVALWVVFSKFKLVRWGWLSGAVSLLVGGFILATFLALFNYLTPSGARHGVRSRGGSDAECDGTDCRNSGQTERTGERGDIVNVAGPSAKTPVGVV